MEWKPLGLTDTEGSWFLKIPGRVDLEVEGHVKESDAKKYTVCKHFLFFRGSSNYPVDIHIHEI